MDDFLLLTSTSRRISGSLCVFFILLVAFLCIIMQRGKTFGHQCILTLQICKQGPPKQKRDFSQLLQLTLSEVEGDRMALFCFEILLKTKSN